MLRFCLRSNVVDPRPLLEKSLSSVALHLDGSKVDICQYIHTCVGVWYEEGVPLYPELHGGKAL